MKAFVIRWRSAKQHREYEIYAEAKIGSPVYRALVASGGIEIWKTGTLWKCPGCYDCTLRTEEFLEGLRRAELSLSAESATPSETSEEARIALEWVGQVSLKMLGCERDRVYIKDASTPCRYGGESYISRI